MNPDDLIKNLPGEDLVRRGLADFAAGKTTVHSCLVQIARPRLSRSGLMPLPVPGESREDELVLYRLLQKEEGDAYARYNALLRELISFENALDHRRTALSRAKAV